MAFLKRSLAGSGKGPVVEAEWHPVDPVEPAALPPSPAPVALRVRRRRDVVRAPMVAPAMARGRCLVCGSDKFVRIMRIGPFSPVLCGAHAATANVAALIIRGFFG